MYLLLLRTDSSGTLDLFRSKDTRDVARIPTDISVIPEALVADGDDAVPQSDVLDEINDGGSASWYALFKSMKVHPIKLSTLRTFYEKKDKNVLSLLSKRRAVVIDDEFRLKMGTGQIRMDTMTSMIDYHLTVANCIGFSPLLPNSPSHHLFQFKMDLKKQIREFKGKHAMLGFDPTGCMLFIGKRDNEDVFLAMAPNSFLQGETTSTRRRRSSASSVMSRRHYRQTVMMIAHFLGELPDLSYLTSHEGIYALDLESEVEEFFMLTDVLYVLSLSLSLSLLHRVLPRIHCFHV